MENNTETLINFDTAETLDNGVQKIKTDDYIIYSNVTDWDNVNIVSFTPGNGGGNGGGFSNWENGTPIENTLVVVGVNDAKNAVDSTATISSILKENNGIAKSYVGIGHSAGGVKSLDYAVNFSKEYPNTDVSVMEIDPMSAGWYNKGDFNNWASNNKENIEYMSNNNIKVNFFQAGSSEDDECVYPYEQLKSMNVKTTLSVNKEINHSSAIKEVVNGGFLENIFGIDKDIVSKFENNDEFLEMYGSINFENMFMESDYKKTIDMINAINNGATGINIEDCIPQIHSDLNNAVLAGSINDTFVDYEITNANFVQGITKGLTSIASAMHTIQNMDQSLSNFESILSCPISELTITNTSYESYIYTGTYVDYIDLNNKNCCDVCSADVSNIRTQFENVISSDNDYLNSMMNGITDLKKHFK